MILKNDAPINWGVTFQDSGSVIAEGIVKFHNILIIYLTVIIIVVLWMTAVTIIRFKSNKLIESQSNHSVTIEIIWTIIPTIIIIGILGPSFSLLYLMDEVIEPVITVKYTGHQWFWSIEYTDNKGMEEIDQYITSDTDLELGALRLLEVDNRVKLPIETEIRVIVTSGDVIHSLGITSLGLKMDGLPGRLNQTSLFILREGVYYGGCSELCGALHGFMPTIIEGVKLENYLMFILALRGDS